MITNSTEAVALNYNNTIKQKLENFTMKSTFQHANGLCGAGYPIPDYDLFETTEFLDRNIYKSMSLEWEDSFSYLYWKLLRESSMQQDFFLLRI